MSVSRYQVNQLQKLSALLMKLPICQGEILHSNNIQHPIQTISSSTTCLDNSSEGKQSRSNVEKDYIEKISRCVEEKTIEGRKARSLPSSSSNIDLCECTCQYISSMLISISLNYLSHSFWLIFYRE